jgi:hypothetical protein
MSIEQRRQPGYYPRYSTLSQRKFWDAATRETIEKRVNDIPPLRFFSPAEEPTIRAVCDRILPQDDRLPEFRIPILNYLDQRLFENKIDGYRYADMPSDQDAYRLAIQAINETAQAIHALPFAQLDPLKQDLILKSIHDGKQLAAPEIWARMSIHRFWALLVGDCVAAYYAHPWAWDEIGFGGPAYPRAYTRLENGLPEPWEEDEVRYEWSAPLTSLSDASEPTQTAEHQSHPGQGGTH